MTINEEVVVLADRCEAKAVEKLRAYLETGDSRSAWDGTDRLAQAEKLLNCAAALRSHP